MIVILPHKHEFPNPFEIGGSHSLARLLCVCEQCGTEMAMCWNFKDEYGEWTYRYPSDTKKRDGEVSKKLAILNKWKDEKKRDFPSHKKEIQEYENRIQELLLKIEEYKEYFDTKTCPVCHGQLEKGFFPLPARSDDWRDVIREHFRESMTEQEIEQLFGTTISDTDIEYIQCLLHKEQTVLEFDRKALYRYWIGRRYEIQKNLREKAGKKVDMLAADVEMTEPEKVPRKENILGSIDGLKDYIRHLLTIEREIYSVGTRLRELYIRQSNTESGILQRKGLLEMELRKPVIASQNEYKAALADLENLKSSALEVVYDTKHIPSPTKPERPILQEPGFFNKKKVLAQNAELTAKYQEACEEYERLLKKYYDDCRAYKIKAKEQAEERHAKRLSDAEERVTEAQEKMEQSQTDAEEQFELICNQPTPTFAIKAFLESEITQAEKTYKELCKCRQQLYASDVVFNKYRNIVALASFYEYLIAGRCETLEGVHGAYNLFEMECRAKEIIGQLQQVVNLLEEVADSLEQIKGSQYLIYSELRHVNSSLNTMNSTMNSMANSLQKVEINTNNTSAYMKAVAQNTEVIAYNTAATAYYSKVNAELTNSLGYLIALN